MKFKPYQFKTLQEKLKKEFKACLIFGQDNGQVDDLADSVSKLIVSDLKDAFLVTRMTMAQIKENPSLLNQEAGAMSLIGGRRLIRIMQADNNLTPSLKYFLEEQTTDTFVVISTDNLTPASSLRKLCESHPFVASFACYADEGRNLQEFIVQILSSQGYRADSEAMAYLQTHLGSDRKVSQSELEKLMVYMGGTKQISFADVSACIGDVSSQSADILILAMAGGKHALVQEKLAGLLQAGQTEVSLIRIVGSYFQKLLLAKSRCLQGETIAQSVAQVVPKLNFKMEPEFKRQLSSWEFKNLVQALCLIEKAEKDCKSSAAVPSVMCAQLFLYLTQACKRQARY
jgi:DNA polymerase III subunit delta